MINVLFLFPDLLNLYADHANVHAVEKRAKECGVKIQIDKSDDIGSLDLSKYHMIYVGSGTESSLDRALFLMMPHKEALKEFVERGGLLLATGSASELFGKSIDTERDKTQAIGILEYGVRRNTNRRILQDCLFESEVFDKKTLGFVNRCSEFYDTQNSLFSVSLGVGYDKTSKNEGFIYKNFIATTLIGPLLVRNPHILDFVMTKLFEISGDKPKTNKISENAQKAYNSAIIELEKRINAK